MSIFNRTHNGRRKRHGYRVAALTLLLTTSPAAAQTQSDSLLPDPRQMAQIEATVDRALEYLLRHQRPDGSWPCAFGNNNGINGNA